MVAATKGAPVFLATRFLATRFPATRFPAARFLATCFVATLLVASSSGAHAQDEASDPDRSSGSDVANGESRVANATETASSLAARHLEDGRRFYRELDFPACVEAMQRALAVSGIGAAQRLEAYEYLGSANVVLDRDEDAMRAFASVFRLDPYHRVREPSGSPKIARFVEALRRQTVPDSALDAGTRIHAELPEAARVDQDIPVRVRAECERDACPPPAQVTLFVRSDEERDWTPQPLRLSGDPLRGGAFEGEATTASGAGSVALYAEARDARGRVLGRAGEPLVPLVLEVREAERVPITRKWWFWTLVGVAVVGAGVAIGVSAATRERAQSGTLPPGRVELP